MHEALNCALRMTVAVTKSVIVCTLHIVPLFTFDCSYSHVIIQDLAVVPLLSPDSDADSSDSNTHSADSEQRIVCEHTSDYTNCSKLPFAGNTVHDIST